MKKRTRRTHKNTKIAKEHFFQKRKEITSYMQLNKLFNK